MKSLMRSMRSLMSTKSLEASLDVPPLLVIFGELLVTMPPKKPLLMPLLAFSEDVIDSLNIY